MALPEGDHEQWHLGASHTEGHDHQEDEKGQQALTLTLAWTASSQRGDDHLMVAPNTPLVQDAGAATVVLSNKVNTASIMLVSPTLIKKVTFHPF